MMDTPRALQPMADPADFERDERVERLLVEGLDHYFAARYDAAIHVWTRVFFLDRSHARARAYIERARTALAEEQRRADELLASSEALLAQGDRVAARRALTEAVAHAADDARAAAIRGRLDRFDWSLLSPASVAPPSRSDGAGGPRRHAPWTRTATVVAALVVAIAGITVVLTGSVLPRWVEVQTPEAVSVDPAPTRLPVLTSAEVALIRAKSLYARGQFSDALVALDRVSVDSPQRGEADRLRVELQRLLLAASARHVAGGGGAGSR